MGVAILQGIESGTDEMKTGGAAGRPRVWLLLGEKRGDNAQIVNLAEAVGWDYEIRRIMMKPEWVTGKPRVRPRLDHVDASRSDAIEAPWPDVLITAGRRLSCVALWIKRESGGRTRLVMVGKPRRLLDEFDLIVAAKHYAVRPRPNLASHALPLMQVDPTALEDAESLWRSRLEVMPKPLTALMVGGPTGGLRFDLATARDLLEKSVASVDRSGGSLYVTTSRRTPEPIVEMLRRESPASAKLFVFDPDAPAEENPYHGLLALADRFIVTTDSASMMVEVARLGRALAIYPLDSELGAFERALTRLGVLRPFSPRTDPLPGGGFRARLMHRLGRPIHSRDLSAIPRWLVEHGWANWLGDPWVEPAPFSDDELESVAMRIRALVESPAGV